VPGRSGVEDNVVVATGQLGIHDQLREVIEGRHLDRALPGQLLFDAAQLAVGHDGPVGPDDALAVSRGRRLRIQVHHIQTTHARDRARLGRHRHAEHVAEIGRRIGADDEHPAAGVAQRHGDGTGDRRLAHAALAGEEQEGCAPGAPLERGRL
jgi:hypothetical protein